MNREQELKKRIEDIRFMWGIILGLRLTIREREMLREQLNNFMIDFAQQLETIIRRPWINFMVPLQLI